MHRLISSMASSSDTSPWLYDVFVSFRGVDTLHTFTAHLYHALIQKGIRIFLNEDELRRGDEISPSLFQAIEGSRIFIIVFSENYTSSTWCLDELVKILDQSKKSKQQRVLPVFYHVNPSDIRHQRGSFGEDLAKHAEKLNVDRVKLRMWKDAIREVANLRGYHLMRNGRNESEFIEEIIQDVSIMTNDHLYNLHVAEHPVGLKPHVENVILRLSVGTKDIRMIGIFGVGGIGKTTLAKAIYNSIAFRFEASCFLPIDSDTSNKVNRLVQLQETLLSKILGDCRSLKVDNIETGINMIKRRLHSKRVLLILDGVDHLTQLENLAGARDWFGKGSRIIITTRDQHLLTTHGVETYKMTVLNHDNAFDLYGRTKKEWESALDQEIHTHVASSSSSSSDTSPWPYDVFLSFRGGDTRYTFIAHLYRALNQKGILTYLYEDELRRGDEISPALLQAIEGSGMFIIVLSKNYASSKWCLDELVKILDQSKKSKKQRVLPVFYHVDPSDVRHQRRSFGEALAKHAEKLNGDMKLQLWKAALQEVANLSGYLLIRNGNESKFIDVIVQDVSRMANDHLYLHVAEHPVGLKPRVEDVNLLLSVGTIDTRMIGIFGVGGIGKTTLAKAIYNSIVFRFEASCFLRIDSETWDQVNRLVQLQGTLLFKIFGDYESLKVDSIDMGITKIKHRLRSIRVLLILDGVDHLNQLETLVGTSNWFGQGSRIIITTRDQHLLTTHGVDSMYEMTGLNYDDAFQLFCWHAFKKQKPVDGYGEFVEQIVNYSGSLPLALTMLGSDLCGRTKKEWISLMDKYRKIPHQDIQKILQTSYDRLSDVEKDVFLDIACFFNGQLRLDDVIIKILDSFGFCPNFSIRRLREKCLISEFDGILQMHDLLRDMGREVVRQESPKNPGARSRLFFHNDIRKVLEDDTGTDRVEAIVADFPDCVDIIRLSPMAFKNMKRLRLFRCRNAQFSGEPNYLPNSISVLDWPNCPLQSMPSKFRGDELFILCMPGSRIQEICFEFKNLMVMNFRGCEFITNISDISRCPNLKEMDFKDCKNLVEVHDSVASLDKLVRLNLSGCNNLKSFPRGLLLRSLQFLDHGSQLSKRRRVDQEDDQDDHNIESNLLEGYV